MAVTTTPWTVTWTIKDAAGRKSRMSIHLPASMPAIAGTGIDPGTVDDPLELYVELCTRLLHGMTAGQIVNVSITKSIFPIAVGNPPFRAAPLPESDVTEVLQMNIGSVKVNIPAIREELLDFDLEEYIDESFPPDIHNEVPGADLFKAPPDAYSLLYLLKFPSELLSPTDGKFEWIFDSITDNRGVYASATTDNYKTAARFRRRRAIKRWTGF